MPKFCWKIVPTEISDASVVTVNSRSKSGILMNDDINFLHSLAQKAIILNSFGFGKDKKQENRPEFMSLIEKIQMAASENTPIILS